MHGQDRAELTDGGSPASLSARAGARVSPDLPWIERAPCAPYFVDHHGRDWHPIGHNDAVNWPELNGLFRRRDVGGVQRHLASLRESGVTCLRVMLEYFQNDHRLLERGTGCFNPRMVAFWDDLVELCQLAGMRLLLMPYDTFFTWIRWSRHPLNAANGGPCPDRTQMLGCPGTRDAIKRRLAFATQRWGGSGVIFAWDLWNEMHPAHANGDTALYHAFIADISQFLRAEEVRCHGRAHLQTVSVFGPELPFDPALRDAIYRHPALDFATIHLYEEGTIDDPQDTVAPARATARLMREGLDEITDGRPFLDTEHGPIHAFKDHHRTLPAPFDDEYFRHMQWAHLAVGGAGGGMRWPNRSPHVLTPGMRQAQRAMAAFLPLLCWQDFARQPFGGALAVSDPAVTGMGCGDGRQALVWLLREALGPDGRVAAGDCQTVQVGIPGLSPGRYDVTVWDTVAGQPLAAWQPARGDDGVLALAVPCVAGDAAIAVRATG